VALGKHWMMASFYRITSFLLDPVNLNIVFQKGREKALDLEDQDTEEKAPGVRRRIGKRSLMKRHS